MPGKKHKQKEPLKEKIDYPKTVAQRVKERLAALDAQKNGEKQLYMAQDVEAYLLRTGRSIRDLKPGEILSIAKALRSEDAS